METISRFRFPLPFRYPGGKHYAVSFLRPFWEYVSHSEYREPLVGGGSVFFNKEKSQFNWINDLDDDLVTTYRVIQDEYQRTKLLEMLAGEVANKKRWKEVFEFDPKDELERAFKFYYLNRTSFSGKLVSAAWGYRPKRSLPPERWHERILPTGEKLTDVKITCLDFEAVITAPANGRTVLLYVDPPYFGPPKNKHYRNGFELEDHYRLCTLLKKTPYNFFLTYDDHPDVRNIYSWANIYEVRFFYRVDNANVQNGVRRMGFELVITNYEIPQQLKLPEVANE